MANAFDTQAVPGPARVPAQYGLFSVLDFREPLDGHWQAGGVRWSVLDGSDGLGIVGATQADVDGEHVPLPGTPKNFTNDGDPQDASEVFTVYSQTVASPIGRVDNYATSRARAKLSAFEERTVEQAISGVIPGIDRPFSVGAAGAGSGSSLLVGVADLEDFLAAEYGSRGVLHISRGNALRAIAAKALETRGNGLFTRLGTPVVAGSGYPKDRIFATSALVAYRSEVFDNVGRPYDLLNKGTNDMHAIAERTYSIGWESDALAQYTLTPDSSDN